jgi:hypothetical protein
VEFAGREPRVTSVSACYCGFGCDRYRSLCFPRPNSQCAQKLFRGLGPVVTDTRLAFQTVRDAMTISPVSLQNLHLTSAIAFTFAPKLTTTRALAHDAR